MVIKNDKIYTNENDFKKDTKCEKVLIINDNEGDDEEDKKIYFFKDKKIKKIDMEYLETLDIMDIENDLMFCIVPTIELYKTGNYLLILVNYNDTYSFFEYSDVYIDKIKKYNLPLIKDFKSLLEHLKKNGKVAE